MQRVPSQPGSHGGSSHYHGPYYGGYYPPYFYSPYYSSPYFYSPYYSAPFYSGSWDSVYSSPYQDQDEGLKHGNIQLRVDPKDVEVIVDGIPTAQGGRTAFDLPTGVHRIEVIRPGYRPWVLDLDVQQGVRYQLEQRLERLPDEERSRGADRPISQQIGKLSLEVRPDDTIVAMDGRTLGMVSLLRGSQALQRIPAGPHTLRFSRPGYKTVEQQIGVPPGRTASVSLDLEREATQEAEG